jgi:exodeoxyribonuclease-3
MKIVTWNVNSVKARLEHVIAYLRDEQPDVLLLQELKCQTEAFPYEAIEDLGYNVKAHGQKSYNGVAILSKHPMDDVITALPSLGQDDDDEQARYIEAVIMAGSDVYRVASVYVPNGTEVDSDRFEYKLRFFDRLREHIKHLMTYEEKLIVGADYNVAAEDQDAYNPKALANTICFHPREQQQWRSLIHSGLTDAYRALHPETQQFTWWDYRAGGYQGNKGLRIDTLLLSPQAADALQACDVDEKPRQKVKPSDHAPVWCDVA